MVTEATACGNKVCESCTTCILTQHINTHFSDYKKPVKPALVNAVIHFGHYFFHIILVTIKHIPLVRAVVRLRIKKSEK